MSGLILFNASALTKNDASIALGEVSDPFSIWSGGFKAAAEHVRSDGARPYRHCYYKNSSLGGSSASEGRVAL